MKIMKNLFWIVVLSMLMIGCGETEDLVREEVRSASTFTHHTHNMESRGIHGLTKQPIEPDNEKRDGDHTPNHDVEQFSPSLSGSSAKEVPPPSLPLSNEIQMYYWETVIDLIFLGVSTYDLITNPNWENAMWFGADVIAIVTPAPSPRALRAAAKLLKAGDKANFYQMPLARYTKENLMKLSGVTNTVRTTNDLQAHHIFPQTFDDLKNGQKFQRLGLDIHNPINMAWWPKKSHQENASKYNKEWREFFEANPNANLEEVYRFGKKIAEKNSKHFHEGKYFFKLSE